MMSFPSFDSKKCFSCGRADNLSADFYFEITRGPLATAQPACTDCVRLWQSGSGPLMSAATLRRRSK